MKCLMVRKWDVGRKTKCEGVQRHVPRHGSEDDQIGLLLVVSYDGILHVTVNQTYRIHTGEDFGYLCEETETNLLSLTMF